MSRVRTHPQLRPRVICAPSLICTLNSGGKLPELLAGDREGGARLEGPQLAIPLSFQRSEDAVADETHTISTSKRRACGLGYRCGPVDTSEEAEKAWRDEVLETAKSLPVLLACKSSWLFGANVPGKPAMFMTYFGGLAPYHERCRQVAQEGYRGFEFTKRQ